MTSILGTIGIVMCDRIFRGRTEPGAVTGSAGETAAAIDLQGDA